MQYIIDTKNVKDLKNEFSHLINKIPDFLNQLKNQLKLNDFDFDNKEVELVDSWFKVKISEKEISVDEMINVKKMFFSYCSTLFIMSNGGEIILNTKKNTTSYGEPIIINYGAPGYPWVAISVFGWMRIIEKEGRLSKSLNETILRDLKNKSE